MKAEIIGQTKDTLLIEWESEDAGFGQISLTYIGTGTYKLDAEYMGIDTILKIFKAINPKGSRELIKYENR